MTGPARSSGMELPIGRRVAQLRIRRGMSQQLFANRIGRSKSWVDKMERGLRPLDRLPVIETVAQALGVAPEVLLATQPPGGEPAMGVARAVERVRATLACYHPPVPGALGPRPAVPLRELDRQVGYAWTAYRHAHHPRVLRMLPDLLADVRQAAAAGSAAAPDHSADLLVRAYRLAAQVLIKVGEPHLAWLAADRAMATAAADPRRTALAAIPLTQALRALHRGRLAMTVATAAVHRLTRRPIREAPPDHLALAGTLLVEAALAAATAGYPAPAHDFITHAYRYAESHGDRHHDETDIGYGPIVVDLARALVAAELGDTGEAANVHARATGSYPWQQLPAEHRAAHLIDITRAHLDAGNPRAAGNALVTADQIAPAETRIRPAARAMLASVLRAGPTAADVTRLAAAIGLTSQP